MDNLRNKDSFRSDKQFYLFWRHSLISFKTSFFGFFWMINIKVTDWNNFSSPKLYLYKETLLYPLFVIQTPTLMVTFKRLQWTKALCDLLGARPAWMIFPIWCSGLWNKLLWHLDFAVQMTKMRTCNIEFPCWYYSFVLLLYVMVIKASQHAELQVCPS